MKPISKGLFLGFIAGGFVGRIVFTFASMLLMSLDEGVFTFMGILVGFMGLWSVIVGMAFVGVLVYKMWQVLQDGNVRTTPGRAVGFLFIPFFNFYWIFQAYVGWVHDYNKYIQEKNINVPKLNEDVSIVFCVLTICSIIPFFGFFVSIANTVFLIVFFNKVCDAVNALLEQQ